MSDFPKYEIWGLDNNSADMDGGPAHHREDCHSLEVARRARAEWQEGGRAAWIQDKETGEHVD